MNLDSAYPIGIYRYILLFRGLKVEVIQYSELV